MRAAQLVEKRRMEVNDVTATPGPPGQVCVRVRAVGICGSDVHYFTHGGLGSRVAELPLSMGHEAAGVIEYNYPGGLVGGLRVAINPLVPCRACSYCARGLTNLCASGKFMGADSPGALRELVYCEPGQLTTLPDAVSFEEGALLEPLSVAMHAVQLARIELGMSIAVFGAGPIGLCVAMVARASGAGEVAVIDPLPYKRRSAVNNFGATMEGGAYPSGRADVAFDCAGMQASVHEAFKCAAPGGKVVLVGIPTFDYVRYNPHVARTKELTIINVRRSRVGLDKCLALLQSRKLPLSRLVTHRWPLGRIQEAFETVESYADGVIKGVIALD